MPEITKINDSLAELEQELTKLRSASDSIQRAEKTAALIINESRNLSERISKETEALTSKVVEKTNSLTKNMIDETKTMTSEVINKTNLLSSEMIDKVDKLTDLVIKKANKTNQEVIQSSTLLQSTSQELANRAETLMGKIDSIDFPTRLEKLDSTVSGINIGVQNVFGRLDNVERNLKDNFDSKEEVINQQLKLLRMLNLISVSLITIVLVIIIIQFFI